MKKLILKLFAAVTASALLLCSCSEKSSGSDNTVRLGTMYTSWPVTFHYAYTSGIYSDLGLNIEESFFDNGPTINEAIASGDLDITATGALPAVSGGIANGTKILAWQSDDGLSNRIYARNDSSIVKTGKGKLDDYPDIYGTADDWKGKKIVCAQGTSSHFTLLATLEAFGLTQDDIEIINMEGASGAAAFAAGTGDLFVGFDPQWSDFQTNSDKYTCVSTCAATGKKLFNVLFAPEEFCNEHSDLVVKFIEGYLKASRQFHDDVESYYTQMHEWKNTYSESSEEMSRFSADIKPMPSLEEQKSYISEENGVSEVEEGLKEIAQFMVDNNLLEQSSVDALFDSDFIQPQYFMEAYENVTAE